MSRLLRFECLICHRETCKKDQSRHIKSSYHLTFTEDKYEQRRLTENKKRMEKYHSTTKEKECEKHDCSCGGRYTTANKSNHEKTEKHQKSLDI